MAEPQEDERASLEELNGAVIDALLRRAAQYGLLPGELEVRYVPNWGGFVNASFMVSDGLQSYLLKLSDADWALERLRRWQRFSAVLAERYRAPRMLDWIDLPDTGFSGPLLEFLPGSPADLPNQPRVLDGILDLLKRLHTDQVLAEALRTELEVDTCTDYFLGVYIDRFDEDLLTVAGNLPPFVSLQTLNWMMGETRELEGLARDLPAFHHPAASPTHGDLWSSNILVHNVQEWYVIDWDDFSLGDPALEYSILFGRLWMDGTISAAGIERRLPTAGQVGYFPGLHERFAVCLRASLLDQVVDNLADWVEAAFDPQHLANVRAEKEKKHLRALVLYRELYS